MSLALDTAAPIAITASEYEELPDELRKRVEVVDGYAYVSPSPTRTHQRILKRLTAMLDAACPPDLECVPGIDLRLHDEPLHVRIPDLVVLRADAEGVLRPDQVVLAVEVISPGTVTRDRLHKRQEYATAGIPHYWLIDWSDGVAFEALRLVGDRYVSGGVFDTGSAQIASPFPCTIDLDALAR